MKMKVILKDEDGMGEMAQGYIETDSFEDKHLMRWNGKLFRFVKNGYENGKMVIFYELCKEPYEITEF